MEMLMNEIRTPAADSIRQFNADAHKRCFVGPPPSVNPKRITVFVDPNEPLYFEKKQGLWWLVPNVEIRIEQDYMLAIERNARQNSSSYKKMTVSEACVYLAACAQRMSWLNGACHWTFSTEEPPKNSPSRASHRNSQQLITELVERGAVREAASLL